MSRGRRPGLQWKPSEVHNEEGEPIAGIGLFNGADAIETGEFIGFYTGHWKEKASAYKGSNDYMFALCADYPADWLGPSTLVTNSLRGWHSPRDPFREGTLSSRIGRRHASPCAVPLPPACGRVVVLPWYPEIPVIKLAI